MWMMVRYKVKRDQLERHLELHSAVYEALESSQPDGLREATFQLEDEVSFVSFVEAEGLPVPGVEKLEEFQRYRADLDERCDEPAVMTPLRVSGSFRFH
ncbi:hypothetical protein [Actinomadura sp. HBU206391]|uniref:hypothetical protein n=1 Tax=Actinomadura sp. HBU206391 TaxID=2731692 RepID=UPI00164F4F87|nr:hypothetical protein [Actinomadura sp. HBU206391]MBC6456914.1 hypothetical protein [Actinomadura sp. HBU206391]